MPIRFIFLALFTVIPGLLMAQDSSNAKIMAELRLTALNTKAEQIRSAQSVNGEKVYGVVMDMPVDAFVVTVVAFETGDASIYTTGSFGMVGGIGHETIRNASKDLVSFAVSQFDLATPTSDFSYPKSDTLRLFLLTSEGVRKIDFMRIEAEKRGTDAFELFDHVQRVITEFRICMSQKQTEGTR